MMNEKVRELLNQQINKEFYSAYLYLDFSNYFEDAGPDNEAQVIRELKSPERVVAIIDKLVAAERISMSKYGKLKING